MVLNKRGRHIAKRNLIRYKWALVTLEDKKIF